MGKTRIFVNDIDVSEFNSSLTSFISFEKDKIIGNVSSKELTMKLENKNGEFNDLLDSPFVLKDEEGNQLGVYYVFKNPERMTSELSLTLYDSIVFSNVFYDSKLEYPCTIEEQLIEMEELIGIEIDFSMVPSEVLNRKINFYDNRETIRTFLGWIAEISSCNVYATPSGSYKFVQLSILASHDITDDDVEKFDKIENYELSGIKYDNGVVIPILSGDETKNVYRLDETNIYLESQENIDLIYSKLVGLTLLRVRILN